MEGHNLLSETTRNLSTSALSTTEHIYLPTASGPMPVAVVIGGVHYAVHSDHLNTPRRLCDANKVVKWQWPFSGFGEIAPQATPATGQAAISYSLRYPGQIDDGNGLFYNWNRFYDPRVGRYTQADPIGLEGGWNRFGYVGGNPMSLVDPLGLRDYSEAETRAILDQERADADAAPLAALFNMLNNHRGRGKMDFGPRSSPADTFDVGCGKRLRPYEFGNYVAGYGGVYFGGPVGYGGVRAGGLLFNAVASAFGRQKFDWDISSAPPIDAGASRAYSEIAGRRDANGYSDCTCRR